MSTSADEVAPIDAVVNLWTPEALSYRTGWRDDFSRASSA